MDSLDGADGLGGLLVPVADDVAGLFFAESVDGVDDPGFGQDFILGHFTSPLSGMCIE